MDFQMIQHRGPEGHTFRFKGEINMLDVALLNLTSLDRALMDDIGNDANPTPADHLQVLEMLFRRHQEQNKPRR